MRHNFGDWKPSLYSAILTFQVKSDGQLYLKGLVNLGPVTYGDVIICAFKCFLQSGSWGLINISLILHIVQSQ